MIHLADGDEQTCGILINYSSGGPVRCQRHVVVARNRVPEVHHEYKLPDQTLQHSKVAASAIIRQSVARAAQQRPPSPKDGLLTSFTRAQGHVYVYTRVYVQPSWIVPVERGTLGAWDALTPLCIKHQAATPQSAATPFLWLQNPALEIVC